MANLCQHFHILPDQGGLLDQDYVVMKQIGFVLDAQEELRKKEQEQRDKEIKKKSGKARKR